MRLVLLCCVVFSLFACVESSDAAFANDPFLPQWGYEKTRVYDAWDLQTGSRDVVVAVIDNGFDYLHPDIRGNVWKNTDEIVGNKKDDDRNGYVDDVWGWNFVPVDTDGDGEISVIEKRGNNDPRPDANGERTEDLHATIHHGTVVAGLIGSVGNNELYGSGVAWRVRLMNVKVASNGGSGVLSDLPQAILYAVDNGADIINLSLVGFYSPEQLLETLRYAKERGVLVIAASGNNAIDLVSSPAYPICADGDTDEQLVLGVTAVRSDRALARFANVGGGCIDIAAPGVSVSSTTRFSPNNGFTEGYGGGWNGTSFAAPFVSGAAALIKSVDMSLGGSDIRRILLASTSKTPTNNEVVYKNLFGAGFLDVGASVQRAVEEKNKKKKTNRTFMLDHTGAIYSGEFESLVFVTSTPALRKLDDVTWFSSVDSGSVFATTKWNNGIVTVSLFSSDWTLIRSFRKSVPVPQRVTLADVDHDTEVDIILSPKINGDGVLFRQYTSKGKSVRIIKPQTGTLQSGVSVSAKRVADETLISVWYMTQNGAFISTLREDGTWMEPILVETPGSQTEMFVSYVSSTLQFTTITTLPDKTFVTVFTENGLQKAQVLLLSQFRSVRMVDVEGKQKIIAISEQSNMIRTYAYPYIKQDKTAVWSYDQKDTGAPMFMLFTHQ
jgi:subtilisin family serine protease